MKLIKADGNNKIITMVGENPITTVDGINLIITDGDNKIQIMVGEITLDPDSKTTVVGDMDTEMKMEMEMETIMVGAITMVGD